MFGGKAASFSQLSMMLLALILVYMFFIVLRKFSSILSLSKGFIIYKCWSFTASIAMIRWFFSLLMWYITLIYWILNWPCIPGVSCCGVHFFIVWSELLMFLWGLCIYILEGHWSVVSFLVMLLSLFGIKIMLVSWSELRSILYASLCWRGLGELVCNLLYISGRIEQWTHLACFFQLW